MGEGFAQQHPSAVDPGAHGSDLHAQSGCDLLIGQLFEIAGDHGGPEIGRQRVEAAWISGSRWFSA